MTRTGRNMISAECRKWVDKCLHGFGSGNFDRVRLEHG